MRQHQPRGHEPPSKAQPFQPLADPNANLPSRAGRSALGLGLACAFAPNRHAGCRCRAGIRVGLAIASADGVVVGGTGLGAHLTGAWRRRRAAFRVRGVLAEQAGRAAPVTGRAAFVADGSGRCLRRVLAESAVTNRGSVRVCDAVVAVVSAVASTDRRPLFRTHLRLGFTDTGAGDLTAVLRLTIFAEQSLCTARSCASRSTTSSGRAECSGGRAFSRLPWRDTVRMGHADVHVRPAVASADRAIVFRACRWHWEAGPARTAFATECLRRVMTDEALRAGFRRCSAALACWPVGVAGWLGLFRARSQHRNA